MYMIQPATIGGLLGATFLVSLATANGLGQGISATGSPHNFVDNIGVGEIGAFGWNRPEEICRVCHVPHDHDRAQNYGQWGLLWNHEVTTATFSMYASATLDGSMASQPTGTSKMCLGCHDGTVGIDTFDQYSGQTVFMKDYNLNSVVPGSSFGGNLMSTHPISIEYDPVADPGLHPVTNLMGASGTILDVLDGGRVQCSSCHDIHDQPGESVPGTHLLRVSQRASQGSASGLCLTCHIK